MILLLMMNTCYGRVLMLAGAVPVAVVVAVSAKAG
jgi:hypothetical protein